MRIEEAPQDIEARCPHCNAELDRLWIKTKGLGVFEQRQVVICPHCHVFLAYGTFAR